VGYPIIILTVLLKN
jgi:hypothetical protein